MQWRDVKKQRIPRPSEAARSGVVQNRCSKLSGVPPSSRRSCNHAIRDFIDWYCSGRWLAFNRTVVTRHRISLEQRRYAPSTINLRLAAVRRLAYEAFNCGLLSPDLAAGIRRIKNASGWASFKNWLSAEQGRPHLRTRWAGASERAEPSRSGHAHSAWSAPG